MKSYTQAGVLVLADITGFTEFVTATELEHGPPIFAELLGEVMRQISPPLEIQEVEGDAVFALGADRALGSPEVLFVGNLDLKIVAHHGRFLRQMVGDRSQVAGVDVILAHRLLKNGVGRRAYILLTEAALRAALASHTERYEHFGDVRCFVRGVDDIFAVSAAI